MDQDRGVDSPSGDIGRTLSPFIHQLVSSYLSPDFRFFVYGSSNVLIKLEKNILFLTQGYFAFEMELNI